MLSEWGHLEGKLEGRNYVGLLADYGASINLGQARGHYRVELWS